MAGPRSRPSAHLASDPERVHACLEQPSYGPIDLRHGPDLGTRGGSRFGLRLRRERRAVEEVEAGVVGQVAQTPTVATPSAADFTVFDSNIVIVIGPTPPGTGEIALATSLTSSKRTSPQTL